MCRYNTVMSRLLKYVSVRNATILKDNNIRESVNNIQFDRKKICILFKQMVTA